MNSVYKAKFETTDQLNNLQTLALQQPDLDSNTFRVSDSLKKKTLENLSCKPPKK